MTANQFRRILRTYTTQLFCWMMVLSSLLMHFLLWASWSPGSEPLVEILWLTQMAGLGLGTMMGMMLNLQFANSRARLLPGFAAAHLIVAGAIVCAFVAFQAVVILAVGAAGVLLLLLSLTLFTIATIAWLNYWMSSISSACGVLICILLVFLPSAKQHIAGPLQALNESPIGCLAIAGVALAAMAALAARLWLLSEEMPEYSRQRPIGWRFLSRAGNRKWRLFEGQTIANSPLQGWCHDLQFRLVLRRNKATGPWRRLLLRQLAGGFAGLSAMMAVFALMAMFLVFLSWWRTPVDVSSVLLLSFFPQHMVFCMLSGLWLRRGPFLARELLRPLGRRDFVRDSARTLACDIAGPAAVHCAMLIIWLALVRPQAAPPGLLLPWVALTAAQYLVAYCVIFWLVAYRHPLALVLGLMAANVVSAGLVAAALFLPDAGFWSPVNVALATIVTGLAVALLYRQAFRRWCRLDFD